MNKTTANTSPGEKGTAEEPSRNAEPNEAGTPADVGRSGQAKAQAETSSGGGVDPLVGALVHVARHFGGRVSATTVTTGLPMPGGRLPLDHVGRAAELAGLLVEPRKTKPAKIDPKELPAIVVLKGDGACVLESYSDDGKSAKVTTFGRDGAEKQEIWSLDDLARRYAGRVLICRPKPARDIELGDVGEKNAWFWSAFKPSAGLYGQILTVSFVSNMLALAVPLFIMNVYDRVVPNAAIDTLWALGIGVLIAGVLDFLLRTLRAYMIDVAGRRADIDLATRLYSRVMGARLSSRSKSSGAQANVMREYETVRDFFTSATLSTFSDMIFIVLFILVIWMVAGRLALVPAIMVPVVIGVALITQIPLSRTAKRAFTESAQKNSVLFETLGGLETIKSVGAEGWAADQWERSVSDTIRTGTRLRLITAINVNLVAAAQVIATVMIVVLGVYDISEGEITTGALIAAVILNGRVVAPLGQVAGVLAKLFQAVVAFRAVSNLMRAPQERTRATPFITLNEYQGSIEFDSVEFSYPGDDKDALAGVSFRVSPGERVGVVGPIGSGKSTVLKLALGLYQPRHGLVLVDGIDLNELDPAVVRSNIGYVPQGAQLFRGTVRQNITLHAPFATDAMLMEAARLSGAADWLRTAPKGFDTPVGERGEELSGGQRQSVALARALLLQPKFLLLDEPTAGLDRASEQALVRRLQENAGDRTLLVVSHSPSIVSLVDRLIVIERGRVSLDGPKDKVMARLAERTKQRSEPGANKSGGSES